jgi:acetate---CoA ligase (ADP-forming)
VYNILDEKMKTCKKPIFPVLPSVINVKNEIEYFISLGRINFPDEVTLGNALTKIFNSAKPAPEIIDLPGIATDKIRTVIDKSENGYLSPEYVQIMLDAAGIPRAGEAVVNTREDAIKEAGYLGFPVVMKVVGPLHKSDVDGVVLNVKDKDQAAREFSRMIKIKDTVAVLIQPMHSGTELFIGAKFEPGFGHMVLCGLGGIFIEVLRDVNSGLSPLTKEEALYMIRNLKGYKIIQGVRGQEGVNEDIFANIVVRVSALVQAAPEIMEMDINPLLGKGDKIVAVDARIRVRSIGV